MNQKSLERSYQLARERYAELGVDTDLALRLLPKIPVSMQCWQGDDVGGFEHGAGALGDGLTVTGNYPGKARTPDELRRDFEQAHALIPGTHRINLHACYAEMEGKKVDRDYTTRLVLMEEAKTLPLGVVWDWRCQSERRGWRK